MTLNMYSYFSDLNCVLDLIVLSRPLHFSLLEVEKCMCVLNGSSSRWLLFSVTM